MRITELFDNGQFVVTAEVGPPKGCHMEHVIEEAYAGLDFGVAAAVEVQGKLDCGFACVTFDFCCAVHVGSNGLR